MFYPLAAQEAAFAEYMWKNKTKFISGERILGFLSCSPRSLRSYMVVVRDIFKQYDYEIVSRQRPWELALFEVKK